MKILLIAAWVALLAGGFALARRSAPCVALHLFPAQYRLGLRDLGVCETERAGKLVGLYLKALAKQDQPLMESDLSATPVLPLLPAGQGVLVVDLSAAQAATINAGSTVAIIDDTGAATLGFSVLTLVCRDRTGDNCSAAIALPDANKGWQTKTEKLKIIRQ
jgi:hypothetical protein